MGSDSEAEKSAQKEKEKRKALAVAPIAKPLAGKKLCKRTLKLIRRGMLYMRVSSTLLLLLWLKCLFSGCEDMTFSLTALLEVNFFYFFI